MSKKIIPFLYSNYQALIKPFIYDRYNGDHVSPNNMIANSEFKRKKSIYPKNNIVSCSSFHNFNFEDKK